MKNFKSKLHFACSRDDLRPMMNYIHFIDGFAYATNGNVLIRHKLEAHDFLPNEIEAMNGRSLHWKAFRQILSYKHVDFTQEEGFICRDGFKCIIPAPLSTTIEANNIPFERVITELLSITTKELSEIGLSITQANLIKSCMLNYHNGIKMEFKGSNKGIVITPIGIDQDDELYILMPMMIF